MRLKKEAQLILGGIMLALALALPIAFHLVGLGSSFLPMFYPIILAGLLLELKVASLVGSLAPLISSWLTGMPPLFPPIAFVMMVEGLVMTSVAFLTYQKKKMNIYLSLIFIVLAERITLLILVLFISSWLELPSLVLGPASLLKGLPGIIIIFLLIPPLTKKIEERIGQSPFLTVPGGRENDKI
ncbi:MAG: ECF transporter S component [Candidatus Aminicenantes bacterium]|nr:ECF transporter S component [Candidatus Aminicenantes bacterium]